MSSMFVINVTDNLHRQLHFLVYHKYLSILSLGNIRKVAQIILPRILWSLTSRILEVICSKRLQTFP